MAVGSSVPYAGDRPGQVSGSQGVSGFRRGFYRTLRRRADALFELCDAVLGAEGPVTSLVELSLQPLHRRGHGSLYDTVNAGVIDSDRLRDLLAQMPIPRMSGGRITLAVDVSNWLRPDAATSPDRLFCHTNGRGKNQAEMVPGWPYSFVAALQTGASSWCQMLDAQRLGPADDAAEVTEAQLRAVVERLVAAGQHQPGDPDMLIVADAGSDMPRMAYQLADLPVVVCGRLRSDRVMLRPAATGRVGPKGGRPAKHGGVFAFADPDTWQAADVASTTSTDNYGLARV